MSESLRKVSFESPLEVSKRRNVPIRLLENASTVGEAHVAETFFRTNRLLLPSIKIVKGDVPIVVDHDLMQGACLPLCNWDAAWRSPLPVCGFAPSTMMQAGASGCVAGAAFRSTFP
ncbi:MAG: hypothetical protein ABIN44_01700 [Burkholderiaceae bacterium]